MRELEDIHTILVVDDEVRIYAVLAALFDPIRTVHATDLESAIAVARIERPDLALVDLSLSGNGADESGFAVLEALRRQAPAMIAIVLTGYATVARAVRAIELGAIDCLEKPSSFEQILRSISKRPARTASGLLPIELPAPAPSDTLRILHIRTSPLFVELPGVEVAETVDEARAALCKLWDLVLIEGSCGQVVALVGLAVRLGARTFVVGGTDETRSAALMAGAVRCVDRAELRDLHALATTPYTPQFLDVSPEDAEFLRRLLATPMPHQIKVQAFDDYLVTRAMAIGGTVRNSAPLAGLARTTLMDKCRRLGIPTNRRRR